jgi:putative FmdB family regulatory protein
MPIYVYKCESCGFEKDALQKITDAPLNTCPHCHNETFKKQVTASSFQLKGSGWYATDFKGTPTPNSISETVSESSTDSPTAIAPVGTASTQETPPAKPAAASTVSVKE